VKASRLLSDRRQLPLTAPPGGLESHRSNAFNHPATMAFIPFVCPSRQTCLYIYNAYLRQKLDKKNASVSGGGSFLRHVKSLLERV
jgi:hypothetical protein